MKRFALAAVLAVGLFALTANQASASGTGTFGISPGSFSIGVGFNVAWSGLSFGRMDGGGGAPCYGPPAHGPQMYDAYGYGGYAHGYPAYYGGYPAYNGYHHGYHGGYHHGPANVPPAPQGQGKK